MPVAGLADRLQIPVRGRDDPVRPRHRLEDHRGDGVRFLVLEDLLEVRRRQTGHGSGCPAGQRYVYGSSIRTTPAIPGSAGQRRGSPVSEIAPVRRSVIRAVASDDLCRPVQPRELDRVLVRLGAAVREEGERRSPGVTSASSRPSCERDSDAIGGPIVHSLVRLLLDRRDDLRVLVADRDVHVSCEAKSR